MNIVITFGQEHAHSISGETLDKDCVAVIACADYEEGRKKAFEYFGGKFGTSYTEAEFDKGNYGKWFPRGKITI